MDRNGKEFYGIALNVVERIGLEGEVVINRMDRFGLEIIGMKRTGLE